MNFGWKTKTKSSFNELNRGPLNQEQEESHLTNKYVALAEFFCKQVSAGRLLTFDLEWSM